MLSIYTNRTQWQLSINIKKNYWEMTMPIKLAKLMLLGGYKHNFQFGI
jgi:hypothetical protein